MNAIVLAGTSLEAEDPLFPFAERGCKALIDMAGKPMVQWVVEALTAAPSVEHIGIIGLPSDHRLAPTDSLTILPDNGGMLANTLAGLHWAREAHPESRYTLVCGADIPALTAEMVEWRVEQAVRAAPYDLDYLVVERATMERRFPGAGRSYVHFRDATVCGGDLHVININMVVRHEIWGRLAAARKSPLRQAALLGLDTLALALLRRLTLDQMGQRISTRLAIEGHLQLSPYPEMAMDVDRPAHVEQLRAELTSRRAV